jgi:ribosomal protein S18 acetylase RimI-like enzyme
MAVEIRMLIAGEENVLAHVAPDVFDNEVEPRLTKEFLADPRHHLGVAFDEGVVVGFASALHYVHPDKPAELWINEVAVAPTHQRRGLAKQLLAVLFAHGRALGCKVAWVLTETDNTAALALYAPAGGKELSRDTVHIEFEL